GDQMPRYIQAPLRHVRYRQAQAAPNPSNSMGLKAAFHISRSGVNCGTFAIVDPLWRIEARPVLLTSSSTMDRVDLQLAPTFGRTRTRNERRGPEGAVDDPLGERACRVQGGEVQLPFRQVGGLLCGAGE